jgi:hypothetical protein
MTTNNNPPAGASQEKLRHFASKTLVIIGPDAPRPDEILVVMAIADGGRLGNRCDTEPIW